MINIVNGNLNEQHPIEIMARMCKGICHWYKSNSIQYKYKYQSGHKRCTYCEVFLDTSENRCPCCSTLLRTRSRQNKNPKRF